MMNVSFLRISPGQLADMFIHRQNSWMPIEIVQVRQRDPLVVFTGEFTYYTENARIVYGEVMFEDGGLICCASYNVHDNRIRVYPRKRIPADRQRLIAEAMRAAMGADEECTVDFTEEPCARWWS